MQLLNIKLVNVRSYRNYPLIQCDQCPCKMRRGTHLCTCEHKGRGEMPHLRSNKHYELWASPEPGPMHDADAPSQLKERTVLTSDLTSRTVKADGNCLSPPQWQFLCFALRSLLPGSPFVIIMPTARGISVRQSTF